MPWAQHPHVNIHAWELQEGNLRARVRPVRHHATLYMWTVVVTHEKAPFANLAPDEYVKIASGDSLSSDFNEALEESKQDAEIALRRAVVCDRCGGRFDPQSRFANRPGTACSACSGAGYVTHIRGLPTGVSAGEV